MGWKEGGREGRCESCNSNDRWGRTQSGRESVRAGEAGLGCLVRDPQEWRHKMGEDRQTDRQDGRKGRRGRG